MTRSDLRPIDRPHGIRGSGVRGGSLTHDLAETIGRAIVSGEFREGFPNEGELTERLGVSRSVVREVVKILTAKGLLSARPRQGTSIEPEARWNLLDPDVLRWLLNREYSVELLIAFAETRLAFEPQAAAMAAQRANADERAEIARAIERMRASVRGEDDPIAADVAFHVAVLEASGNPFFRQLRELVNTALRASMRQTHRVKSPQTTLGMHEATADAILAGDAEAAHDHMRRMMLDVLAILPTRRP
jgi:DNA-binding FadR family transcriptional regulator